MLEPVFNAIALFFNSQWGFIAFAVASFILVFALSRDQKIFVASVLIALALGLGLKAFFGVERPCVENDSLAPCPASGGFPSTHAVVATALAMGALGTFLFWPMLFLAIAVSLSRVWLGVHSLEQVAGGMALAVMIYLAVFEAYHKLYGKKYFEFDLSRALEENLLTKRI